MATKSRTQWLAHGLYEQGTVLLLSAQKGEALAGDDGIAVAASFLFISHSFHKSFRLKKQIV